MNNKDWANKIVQQLLEQDIRVFCVCTGARNAALISEIATAKGVEVFYFVDERSAAFFALGKALELQTPVVVCTTSGTAVAEMLPAVIEGRYTGAPLLLLTADRPSRFRNTGAPQSIDQLSFLSQHVTNQWDLNHPDDVPNISGNGPQHLNVCFEEPIMEEPWVYNKTHIPQKLGQRPLVILGSLFDEQKTMVKDFLMSRSGYCLVESHSGLRGQLQNSQMQELSVMTVTAQSFRSNFDSVLRIGGVPTLRLWRDLEYQLSDIPVVNISDSHFSGLGRQPESALPFKKLVDIDWVRYKADESLLLKQDQLSERILSLIETYPTSELAMVRRFSELIPDRSMVFLGNSLPVREWDLVACPNPNFCIRTQRGVNGIDGLISTFLGRLKKDQENILIIGDLTAVYDTNAYWVWNQTLKGLKGYKIRLVIINNFGGRIFRRIFKDEVIQTPHQQSFSDFSRLFDLPYVLWKNCDQFQWEKLPEQSLVEIQPDLSASDEAWAWIHG